jgi:hypothetical protein
MLAIVNDTDLVNLGHDWWNHNDPQSPLVFKIHGCLARQDEQLILTRHDYRHHYRANERFFDAVRSILQSRHILFAGFSHRDPEVTRLVEDAIYQFEREAKTQPATAERPHFYSLQFDMLEHTPEIFAAKGLVALKPPFFPAAPSQGRSLSLCVAIGELANSQQADLHKDAAIDDDLQRLATLVTAKTKEAIEKMKALVPDLLAALKTNNCGSSCAPLIAQIGQLAAQGVYLLDQQGELKDCAVPAGLDPIKRAQKMPTMFERPYFRIAKSFREPYISDSFRSVYNGNSTVAICVPVVEGIQFKGLVFAATHVGMWDWLKVEVEAQWAKNRAVVLIDANGIALFPPNQEVSLRTGTKMKRHLLIATEDPAANIGHRFDDLFALSRRDALVRHLVENIVPLSQDDDVFELGGDFEYYSVVTEIPATRWKLGISQPFAKVT